jgi:hypothetical protein
MGRPRIYKLSKETREKISKGRSAYFAQPSARKRWSILQKEVQNRPEVKAKAARRRKGYKHSWETMKKMVKTSRARLDAKRAKGLPLYSYSFVACRFFDAASKVLGVDIQHAENGGEKEMGHYRFDGFILCLKEIWEWDGIGHCDPEDQKYDRQRDWNILSKLKGFKVRRFDEEKVLQLWHEGNPLTEALYKEIEERCSKCTILHRRTN